MDQAAASVTRARGQRLVERVIWMLIVVVLSVMQLAVFAALLALT
jgi:hypothetical protein